MRDARDGLPERGHLLGLQQLVVDVARLVVQLLALADVADERLEAEALPSAAGASARAVSSTQTGCAVGAPQPQQVVVDRAVGGEPFEQRDARLGIDEAIGIEGADVALGRFARDSRRSA